MAIDETGVTPLKFLVNLTIGEWGDNYTPPSKYSELIEVTPIEISPVTQEDEYLIGVSATNLGKTLGADRKPKGEPAQISFTTLNMTAGIRALFTGATVSEVTVAATAVTDRPITLVLNEWIDIGAYNINPSGFLVETDGSPDVEVAATKYEVDYVAGLVKAIHADAVGAKLVTFTPYAATYEKYAAGGATSAWYHLKGSAFDRASGLWQPFDVWRCRVSAEGAFDPSTGVFMKATFSGTIVEPTDASGDYVEICGRTPSSPWEWMRRTA